MKIARALLSLSDKTGLLPFARALVGGVRRRTPLHRRHRQTFTRRRPARDRGRRLHGLPRNARWSRQDAPSEGPRRPLILARRSPRINSRPEAHGIRPIDLLVVNLYPFRETVAKPGVTLEEAIEQHRHRRPVHAAQRGEERPFSVTVVSDPADYDRRARGHARQRRRNHAGPARASGRQGTFRPPAPTTRPSPGSSTANRPRARPTICRCRSSAGCATARTRIRRHRSTAGSRSISRSSTARSYPSTTSSTSPPPRS